MGSTNEQMSAVSAATVILLAGPKGSGKTTSASTLAHSLGAVLLSFGSYVRNEAAARGLPDSPRMLADLGETLLHQNGVDAFVDGAIAFAGWSGNTPLVVDGLRHMAVLHALKRRFPQAKLIYLDAPTTLRHDRLRIRDGSSADDSIALGDHSTEAEARPLREAADRVLTISTETSLTPELLISELHAHQRPNPFATTAP